MNEEALGRLVMALHDANRIHLCWALLLENYLASKDEWIRQSARDLLTLFLQVVARNNGVLDALVRDDVETAAERFASFEAVRGADRERLATLILGYQRSIAEDEKRASALGTAEKRALLRAIERTFGPELGDSETDSLVNRVAAKIHSELLSADDAGEVPSCEQAADRLYAMTRPRSLGGMLGHFSHVVVIAEKWGGHAQGFMDRAIIRRDGSYGFLNAEIHELNCRGQRRHLVVLGERWLFLVWRVNGLLARYWEPGQLYGFRPPRTGRKWPDPATVEDFVTALDAYYGLGKPSDIGTLGLQSALAEADMLTAYSSVMAGEVAALFVLLHEASHLDGFRRSLPWRSAFERSLAGSEEAGEKQAGWHSELLADGAALVALWETAATGPIGAGAKAGALTLVSAEGVLQSLAFLDRVDAALGTTNGDGRGGSTHPPTELRRKSVRRVFEGVAASKGLDEAQIKEALDAMTAAGVAWQALADHVMENRGDLISELRALRP
jgi:hypothetical protein